MTPLERTKVWSDIVATWVTVLAALVGGAYGLQQYFEKRDDDRVKFALTYLERFNSPHFLKIRTSLDEWWLPLSNDLRRLANDPGLADFVMAQVNHGKQHVALTQLFEFMDEVHACSCADLCDRATVNRFLGKPALDLWALFYPVLKDERTRGGDPTFGAGLEALADQHVRGTASGATPVLNCGQMYRSHPTEPSH